MIVKKIEKFHDTGKPIAATIRIDVDELKTIREVFYSTAPDDIDRETYGYYFDKIWRELNEILSTMYKKNEM